MIRNYKIDFLRYIAALLVVTIHMDIFSDVNKFLNYFIVHLVAPLAVPFFFIVSGYFCKFNENSTLKDLFKCISRQIIPYLLWSFIYLLLSLYQKQPIDILYQLSISGIYYHLWFIPALIYGNICLFIVKKYNLKRVMIVMALILYLLGCLSSGYYKIGLHIPLFSNVLLSPWLIDIRRIFFMATPLMLIGSILKNIFRTNYISTNSYCIFTLFLIFLYLIENVLLSYLSIAFDNLIIITIAPLVGSLIILMDELDGFENKRTCINFKELSMMTYYAHPLVIAILSSLLARLRIFNINSFINFLLVNVIILAFYNLVLFRNKNYGKKS